jgi:CDP-diacylglycerol--serine O-phosphatidyltransferase
MSHKNVLIPSVFTFLNFLFGILSIVMTIEGNLISAAWFIILAILCDGMDGKLARWTGSESPFGFELDSLADMISSGVAPALLAYRGGFTEVKTIGFVICFLYIVAGAYRLARFNVIQAGDRSRGYSGLPIPIAGMTVASFWLFRIDLTPVVNGECWAVLMVFLSILMVSTIHYDWPRLVFSDWKNTVQSALLLLGIGLMAIFPGWCLFPLLLLYIKLGILQWAGALIRGEVTLSGFFL